MLTKTKPLKRIAKDFNTGKEYEVTYYLDYFEQTGNYCILTDYEDLRLSVNMEKLPNNSWSYFYFHHSMYWLVLPLLNEGIIKMTPDTWVYTVRKIRQSINLTNYILCEIDEKYFL